MSVEFREWLLLRLRGTRYAQQALKGSIDDAAKRLGVQTDLLLEARADVMLDRHREGRQITRRNARQIDIFMPPTVYEAWKDECVARGVEGPTLLRSAIHHYLLHTWEPRDLLPHWRYDGKLYRCGRHASKFPRERADVTTGAWRALQQRARLQGASAAMVMRGLVQDILGGGFRTIPLVPAGNLYDDEKRYVTSVRAADVLPKRRRR